MRLVICPLLNPFLTDVGQYGIAGPGNNFKRLPPYGHSPMKITITLTDTEDGSVEVNEERFPDSGETVETVTVATALADAIMEHMEELGEDE